MTFITGNKSYVKRVYIYYACLELTKYNKINNNKYYYIKTHKLWSYNYTNVLNNGDLK